MVLTVNATSVGVTHSGTTSLTIGPEFRVLESGAPTIMAGQSGSATANVSSLGGFNSNVALSMLDLPVGVTATFSPSTVTGASGSSTITINTTTQATGTVSATVQGYRRRPDADSAADSIHKRLYYLAASAVSRWRLSKLVSDGKRSEVYKRWPSN